MAQSVTTGYQDVITYLTVLLIAAVIVSALRGRDPVRTSAPRE